MVNSDIAQGLTWLEEILLLVTIHPDVKNHGLTVRAQALLTGLLQSFICKWSPPDTEIDVVLELYKSL